MAPPTCNGLVALVGLAALSCTSAVRIAKRRGDAMPSSDKEDWVVTFKPSTTDAMIEIFCAGRCSYRGSPDAGGVAFALLSGDWKDEAKVRDMSHVERKERDFEVEDDPEEEIAQDASDMAVPWSLAKIGVPQARAKGRGVNIYVLDSGVRASHVEFGGRVVPTFDGFQERECLDGETGCANDKHGHGTHVAGSAGGATYGVAPQATIRAITRGGTMARAIMGMDFVARKGQKPAVLTMSFGSPGTNRGAEVAVDAVLSSGVTVTVAAGNRGWDGCQTCFAYMEGVIAVANSDQYDGRSRSSNYGSCTDIFAPGVSIVSASHNSDNGSTTKGGTSMSAPHVAGAVALVLELNPHMGPQDVKADLQQSAAKSVITDARGSPNLRLNVAGY